MQVRAFERYIFLSIYKIPMTVYSSKITVRITGLEARWCLGKFTANALHFHKFIYKQIHVNKIHSGP